MVKSGDPLSRIVIAAPCPVSWQSMKGDERVRHCQGCSKNVYNISELSKTEAEELLRNSSEKLCLRIFRRRDGTIITNDCPVGLRFIRNTFHRFLRSLMVIVSQLVFTNVRIAANRAVSEAAKPSQVPEEVNNSNPGTAWTIRANYFLRFPVGGEAAPSPDSVDGEDGEDEVEDLDFQDQSGPVLIYPDKSAYLEYCSALKSEKLGDLKLADAHFRAALKALMKPGCDWKLKKDVEMSYAAFLKAQGKDIRAVFWGSH